MSERAVERSAPDRLDDDERGDSDVWRSLVDRLVEEGEPLANALRIADRIVRNERRVGAARDGDSGDAGDSRPSDG